MKQFVPLIIFLFSLKFVFAQSLDELDFGEDHTLEVITWNIEYFPKTGSKTVDYVQQIIENLDVDIIALQEIKSKSYFNQLLNGLSDYDSYADISEYGGLAYIYKTGTFEVKKIYEIYTTPAYWKNFPRAPMVMELTYNDDDYVIINNHLKCCGDGILDLENKDDQETKRYNANKLLKEYINSHFSDKKVLVVGDFNDDITDTYKNNVFREFNNEPDKYKFADMAIAEGSSSNWSYPSWPAHLDHILITNDLFDNVITTETVLIDDYISGGLTNYDYNISDHRPVAIKLKGKSNSIDENIEENTDFSYYPNPVKDEVVIRFNSEIEATDLIIFNVQGEDVHTEKIKKGTRRISLNMANLSTGIYFLKIYSDKKVLITQKIVVLK